MGNANELQEEILQLEMALASKKNELELIKAFKLIAQNYGFVTFPNDTHDIGQRVSLLNEAAGKPIRTMVQLDYFNEETGACGYSGAQFEVFGPMARNELNRSDCLRMLIPMHYTRADILNGIEQFKVIIEKKDADTYADIPLFHPKNEAPDRELDIYANVDVGIPF